MFFFPDKGLFTKGNKKWLYEYQAGGHWKHFCPFNKLRFIRYYKETLHNCRATPQPQQGLRGTPSWRTMTLPLCAEGGWGWTKPSWAHRAGGSRDGHSSTYSRVCGAPGPAVGLPPPCRTHLVLQQRRQRLEVVAGHLLLLLIKPILRSAHGLHSARGGSRGFASSAPLRTQSTAPAVPHPHARLRAAPGGDPRGAALARPL